MGLKNYKFVWFTEGGWTGKVSIDNPNMRNDVSTKYVLGADQKDNLESRMKEATNKEELK